MIGRRSVILTEADRWLFPVVLLVSIYITFRGHNAPGGGFIGGLIAGAAFIIRYLAGTPLTHRWHRALNPTTGVWPSSSVLLMPLCIRAVRQLATA
jgi:multisubunit Na+/H+ antiporter MnhB subunit